MKDMMWITRMGRLALCALSLGTVTACGPPDFERMSPTVWKPVAEVVLLGGPPHWQATDVETVAARAGVAVQIDTSAEGGATAAIRRILAWAQPGLVVAVSREGPDDAWLQLAASHPATRFEWLGADLPVGPLPSNARVVAPDPQWVAAAAGYLAGRLEATASGIGTIGWLVDGESDVTQAEVRQTLAALVTAAPDARIVPVQIAADGPWPRWVIVDRVLRTDEFMALIRHGCDVISLCVQPAGIDAVQPAAPTVDSLAADLSTFANQRWQAGERLLRSDHALVWSAQVPVPVAGDVTSWLTDLLASGSQPPQALTSDQARAWAWILARGH